MDTVFSMLPQVLLPWYYANMRILPWRVDKDPYHVWLSEIMLQQTRVEAVKNYYTRFLGELPTIENLARCDDDKLHKLWEGLGYYSRVRNLKKAAQVIVNEYSGHFPRDYHQVLSLPGIGEYTAGAVCSICFDQPVPAVDGNVLRVIARITDDHTPVDIPAHKKQVREELFRIYPAQAGDFTQALMELGATVCGPNKKPDCVNCPCKDFCLGHARGTAEKLPVKQPRRSRREEDKTVLIISCSNSYALIKRPDTGLLAGLWQFPDAEGFLDAQQALSLVESMGLQPMQIYRERTLIHIFTHVQWNMRGFYVEVARQEGPFTWFTGEALEKEAALPTAYRQFWK